MAAPTIGVQIKKVLSGTGGAFVGLILLFVVLSVIAPNFLTSRNLLNMVDQVRRERAERCQGEVGSHRAGPGEG